MKTIKILFLILFISHNIAILSSDKNNKNNKKQTKEQKNNEEKDNKDAALARYYQQQEDNEALELAIKISNNLNIDNNSKNNKKQNNDEKRKKETKSILEYKVEKLTSMRQSDRACAFYAIYNAINLYLWLDGNINKQELAERLNNEIYFQLEEWQQYLQKSKNLNQIEINKLASQYLPKGTFSIIPADYKIILNPHIDIPIEGTHEKVQVYLDLFIDYPQLNNAIKKIRNTNNAIHVFIINNFNASELTAKKPYPGQEIQINNKKNDSMHCITIAVQKNIIDGTLNYYLTDSSFCSEDMLNNMIQSLHKLITEYPVN